jgi:hypothetical protein
MISIDTDCDEVNVKKSAGDALDPSREGPTE